MCLYRINIVTLLEMGLEMEIRMRLCVGLHLKDLED
jgi:hypothetical protein